MKETPMNNSCCDCSSKKQNIKFKLGLLEWSAVVLIILEVSSFFDAHLPTPFSWIIPLGIIVYFGKNTFLKGFKALKKINFSNIRLLMMIAVVGACILGEFLEGALVIVLFEIAEKLEEYGITSSKSALRSLINSIPKVARKKGIEDPISVSSLEIGDIIEIRPGETIPVDSIVLSGSSSVDESSITGEPIAADKDKEDKLYSGSLNLHGFLEAKVIKLAKDSTINQISKIIEEGFKNKSNTEKFIEKFSKYYTPLILIVAGLVFLIPVFYFGKDASFWAKEALSLLIIACPCALVISTPISIYSAIGAASKVGVIIKGGLSLEKLGAIKAVAFDKTRTLTTGKPQVVAIKSFSHMNENELLSCASGLELKSEHPLAEGILNNLKDKNLVSHETSNFEYSPGGGLSARCLVCHDEDRFIGKLSFIEERTSIANEVKNWVHQEQDLGKTSVVLASKNKILGALSLQDTVRDESAEVIKNLRLLDTKTFMLTGDSIASANYWSKQLKIDQGKGALLPIDKLEEIKNIQTKVGPVAFVGDGINDGPALAQADVGIAMGGGGSDLAIEAAEISLTRDNLRLVPLLIELGRKTLSTIRLNTTIAVFAKISVLIMAFFGKANLVMAIMADVGITILVVLISLRLRKKLA